jgi:hypothetical protein
MRQTRGSLCRGRHHQRELLNVQSVRGHAPRASGRELGHGGEEGSEARSPREERVLLRFSEIAGEPQSQRAREAQGRDRAGAEGGIFNPILCHTLGFFVLPINCHTLASFLFLLSHAACGAVAVVSARAASSSCIRRSMAPSCFSSVSLFLAALPSLATGLFLDVDAGRARCLFEVLSKHDLVKGEYTLQQSADSAERVPFEFKVGANGVCLQSARAGAYLRARPFPPSSRRSRALKARWSFSSATRPRPCLVSPRPWAAATRCVSQTSRPSSSAWSSSGWLAPPPSTTATWQKRST